jgi:RimJ/RimL family protein N-acetyltransferase
MAVSLRCLSFEECQQVREWRNAPDVLPMLRTGAKTADEQAAFYRDVVCQPRADHRYYALDACDRFVGMGGLTYFSRVPGEAEISLVIGPMYRRAGLGRAAVLALLHTAFTSLGLYSVVGECYRQSPALWFWLRLATEDGCEMWTTRTSLFFRWTAPRHLVQQRLSGTFHHPV